MSFTSGTEADLETTTGLVHVRVWRGSQAGDGLALVCLHGLTDSGEMYENLWQALARRVTVVAPDLPGHGGSPWTPSARYDLVGPARGIAEVLDELPRLAGGRQQCVVLGHSLGAVTAAHVASLRPRLVRHLILEEPPRRMWPARYFQRKEQVWLDRLQALDHDGRMAMPLDNQGWLAGEVAAWSRSKVDCDRRIFDVPIGWGADLTQVLHGVQCPTTLVLGSAGRGSTNRPRRASALVAACSGGGRAIRLESGHSPRRDASDAFTSVIEAVLSETRPTPDVP